MRLTPEEEALLKMARARAAAGIPIADQMSRLAMMSAKAARKRKVPSFAGLVEAQSFLLEVEHLHGCLLRLQRGTPRGRKTVDRIIEHLARKNPKAGAWERNAWLYLATHLSEHRTKAIPDFSLTDRAALMAMEKMRDCWDHPNPSGAKSLLINNRQRARDALGSYSRHGMPARVSSHTATVRFLSERTSGVGLSIPDRSIEWLMRRHASISTTGGKK